MTEGKPVPFKLLGYDSCNDLLNNIPEYVKVLQVEGHTLLLGVANEVTRHVQKLVGNQYDNTRGFNRRTVDVVSRLDNKTRSKISEEAGFRDREVSDLVKSQIRELLEMDDNINGILLSQLPSEYYKFYSYHIDHEEYGYKSLEDFCINGLAEEVDVDLDSGNFKIVEKGMLGLTKSISVPKEIPNQVRNNIITVMRNNSGPDMSSEEFIRKYSETFQSLDLVQFRVRGLDELCLLMPDTVQVTAGGRVSLLGKEEGEEGGVDVSQVAANVADLLQGHKQCLDIKDFIRGYEGYHGSIHKAVKEAGASGVIQLLSMMEEVCEVVTSNTGETVVVPVAQSTVSVPGNVLTNIKRILTDHPYGVAVTEVPRLYLEYTGNILDYVQFGFHSVLSLLQDLARQSDTNIQLLGDTVQLSQAETESGESGLELTAGWVMVQARGEGRLVLQHLRTVEQVRRLEEEMEEFYSAGKNVKRLSRSQEYQGRLVAALYTDLAWHRARVVRTEGVCLVLEYVDWGWEATVTKEYIRQLEGQFCALAQQAVYVRRSQVEVVGEVGWEEAVRQDGRGRGRVERREGGEGLALQLYRALSPGTRPPGLGQFRNYKLRHVRRVRDKD